MSNTFMTDEQMEDLERKAGRLCLALSVAKALEDEEAGVAMNTEELYDFICMSDQQFHEKQNGQ